MTIWINQPYDILFLVLNVFLIPVTILVYLLEKIPDPTPIEAAEKSIRVPMDKNERKRFFNMFSFGLVSFIFIYILLTLFRDIRDNFAADIWLELGYGNSAGIFTSTELPIAFSVLVLIASMIYINNNKLAFQISQIIILVQFCINTPQLSGISYWGSRPPLMGADCPWLKIW